MNSSNIDAAINLLAKKKRIMELVKNVEERKSILRKSHRNIENHVYSSISFGQNHRQVSLPVTISEVESFIDILSKNISEQLAAIGINVSESAVSSGEDDIVPFRDEDL